jgi:hypothetical protein
MAGMVCLILVIAGLIVRRNHRRGMCVKEDGTDIAALSPERKV